MLHISICVAFFWVYKQVLELNSTFYLINTYFLCRIGNLLSLFCVNIRNGVQFYIF